VNGTNLETAVNIRGSSNTLINVGNPAGNTLNEILSPITITGIVGDNTVNLNDNGSNTAHSYSLTNNSLARDGNTLANYNFTDKVNLYGGGGGNTVNIKSTFFLATTVVNSGTSIDIVNIGNDAGTLDDIIGALVIK
jgi:hypothetical protein